CGPPGHDGPRAGEPDVAAGVEVEYLPAARPSGAAISRDWTINVVLESSRQGPQSLLSHSLWSQRSTRRSSLTTLSTTWVYVFSTYSMDPRRLMNASSSRVFRRRTTTMESHSPVTSYTGFTRSPFAILRWTSRSFPLWISTPTTAITSKPSFDSSMRGA